MSNKNNKKLKKNNENTLPQLPAIIIHNILKYCEHSLFMKRFTLNKEFYLEFLQTEKTYKNLIQKIQYEIDTYDSDNFKTIISFNVINDVIQHYITSSLLGMHSITISILIQIELYVLFSISAYYYSLMFNQIDKQHIINIKIDKTNIIKQVNILMKEKNSVDVSNYIGYLFDLNISRSNNKNNNHFIHNEQYYECCVCNYLFILKLIQRCILTNYHKIIQYEIMSYINLDKICKNMQYDCKYIKKNITKNNNEIKKIINVINFSSTCLHVHL
jgi:hypothetical protein